MWNTRKCLILKIERKYKRYYNTIDTSDILTYFVHNNCAYIKSKDRYLIKIIANLSQNLVKLCIFIEA